MQQIKRTDTDILALEQNLNKQLADNNYNSTEIILNEIARASNDLNQLFSTYRQYESYTISVNNSIGKVEGLIDKRQKSQRVINTNEEWLSKYADQLRADEIQRVQNELEKLTVESQEKIQWINEIKLHREALGTNADDGSCPLCGFDYGSYEVLINTMREKTKIWEQYHASFFKQAQEATDNL